MANPPDSKDLESWHRFFAIEANNRAWDMAENFDGSTDQAIEMLNAAHASALHWAEAGTELKAMRARLLLGEVHALLGFGETALVLSGEAREYFLGRSTDDWEVALVHAVCAHAAAAAGLSNAHKTSYQAAQRAIDAIQGKADRKIVMQTFSKVPVPGSA